MYPRINNWLRFRRIAEDEYEVEDCIYEMSYRMERRLALFAKRLDGRDPYAAAPGECAEDVDDMLEVLDENGLLRHSAVLTTGIGTLYYTVSYMRRSPALQCIAVLSNAALCILWLPVFLAGLFLFINDYPIQNFDHFILGSIGGTLCGALLHELGHAFAGIAYGARVFEMGVMIQTFIPGAYVLMDSENVKSRMKRIQINAAGIEMNLALSGLCLLLAYGIPDWGAAFFCAAVINIFLAAVNLTFVDVFDGAHILWDLLGLEHVAPVADRIVRSRKRRRGLYRKGATGYVLVIILWILKLMQVALPILVCLNIIEIIGWFC